MSEFATDLRRALIHAVPGSGAPRPVALISVEGNLEYWRRAYDLATDALLESPLGDTDALIAATENLEVVRLRLAAAVRQYRRARAEAEGRRWLRGVSRG